MNASFSKHVKDDDKLVPAAKDKGYGAIKQGSGEKGRKNPVLGVDKSFSKGIFKTYDDSKPTSSLADSKKFQRRKPTDIKPLETKIDLS